MRVKLPHVIRSWFRFLLESDARQSKKLFVEQLEDRCFLTAITPLSDGMSAPEPITSPSEFDQELPASGQQLDPNLLMPEDLEEVEDISPVAIPEWAQAEITEASGEFVESFQLGDGATAVHFRDANGDSKILYRDSVLVREIPLTDLIANRLDEIGLREQAVREINELNVNLIAQPNSQLVQFEGLATLESPDGITRLVGFLSLIHI